ncbi:MAG: DNA mismatch repair endonuclease MutL [Anaerolineales bacterium]
MNIHVLPTEVASQIAAGEVVERPASVVKELLENSLDAQAGRISITILSAGRKLIEVSDDGWGIEKDDIPLAVRRHATSKIENITDLTRIKTLGFRGEALASISSVSRFQLTSRTKDKEYAWRLIVEGGVESSIEAVGAPFGTTVRVEDLFFNVPARLKFLKQAQTERIRIDQLVGNYAIAFPQVQFQLSHDGKIAFTTSGNGDRMEALTALLGLEIAKKMIEVVYEEREIRIYGYISPPQLTRSNRKELQFFINQRPVQDSALASAVIQAYHTYLMVGRYPIVKLFIEIDAAQVDVNVHPAKAEVRFANPNWIFSQVQYAVRRALMAHSPIPQIPASPIWQSSWESYHAERMPQRDYSNPSAPSYPIQEAKQIETIEKIPLLRLIGQIATTYLVAEGPDGLYLIDQHAAHERVLFEKFLKNQKQNPASQNLLEAVIVTLPITQAQILEEQLDILNQIGFVIENFGPATYKIRAMPEILSGMNPRAALNAVVEDLEEDETPLEKERIKKLIARICKRAAVKAGQTLSIEEQRTLLANLEACDSPRTCPHGRPTMIHLSVDLLERQFGRKGAI